MNIVDGISDEISALDFSDDLGAKCIHSIYGYGFEVDSLAITSFKDYIQKNKTILMSALTNQKGCTEEESQSIIDTISSADGVTSEDAYMDITNSLDSSVLEDPVTGEESIFTFIAMIMTEKTGIRFGFHADYIPDNTTEENFYIMFDIRVPWDLNNKERNITEDRLVAVINDAATELDLPTATDRSLEVFWCE